MYRLHAVQRRAPGPGVLAILLLAADPAAADPAADPAAADPVPDLAGDPAGEPVASICTTGVYRCHARMQRAASAGEIRPHAAPAGYGPAELQSAYNIRPDVTVTDRPTVAIVGAFGYAAIESDLAVYRAEFGLPPCTIASGCLTVVNQRGQPSPLPPDPPTSDDWTVEAALDMAMVSAACPLCKILIVQADDNVRGGLFAAQATAARLGAAVISNSWGGPEQPGTPPSVTAATEAQMDQPGVAIFVSAGDDGFNDGGEGPDYPATSAHTIAVGGTRLVRGGGPRGWLEGAWARGGSACSLSIAKPAYQTASPCPFRATSDIAAVGDPATGVAAYNRRAGGWLVLGGTSASAPLVAAIFAATGNGAQRSAAFLAAGPERLYDVTVGRNGPCEDVLCNAGVGWDGPTGYGTPDATALFPPGFVVPPRVETPDDGGGFLGGCAAGGGSAGTLGALGLLVAAMLRGRRSRRSRSYRAA